ncbi:MAG TPA: fused MFS/spermidine synthase [Bryobacteraceae bacterium]|nr:fused MFS/spermidine synthase [Bryobacteraceae bacterium]
MTLYAATIFLSAFLLFQVQPLIAKIILPWFGGSAAVWSASLLFFQLLLLGGYAYAHLSIRYLKPRGQMLFHAALLAGSCALLPILPNPVWRPTAAGDPTFRILAVLGATIGLPYFLLSSTSPLLQAWYVRRSGSGLPYRLFALSNFGSLLALVSFPFLVEPQLSSRQQAYTWSSVYVAFALVCAFTAWVSKDAATAAGERPVAAMPTAEVAPTASSTDSGAIEIPAHNSQPAHSGPPGFLLMAFWVLLAACASVLLISVTNHMSQNVAPIPLLWVLPLAIYLLTFIFAFESDRIYQRWLFLPLLVPALGGMAYMIYAAEGNLTIKWAIPGFAAGLFVCCMLCHGELARRRPAPQYLTLFYLMVSLGGALGGVFVALIAPRIFVTYLELELGLVACGVLALIAVWNANFPGLGAWPVVALIVIGLGEAFAGVFYAYVVPRISHELGIGLIECSILPVVAASSAKLPKLGAWPVRFVVVLGIGALAGYVGQKERNLSSGVHLRVRNFYGPLEVRDDAPTEPYAERTLMHGTINHGSQLIDPVLKYVSTSYYGKNSGLGRAIQAIEARGPIRLGSIGLGAGVTSNYGRKGDYVRIYEINPLIEGIAQTQFSFYTHSAADKQILMGDARLTLERQEPQNFDLLAVDAFSSDAIPVHLLTREAVGLYFRHLKPDGILALHISNRYLDLEPVCLGDAKAYGKIARTVNDDGEEAPYFSSSTWVLLTSNAAWFDAPSFKGADMHPAKDRSNFRPWTDDYSNLFQILSLK